MIENDAALGRLNARNRKRLRQKRYENPKHRLTRKMLVPFVAAGLAKCVRCGQPIEPGPWDLGHDDKDPRFHTGPEHTWCNRGAPNRNATSREW